MSQAARFKQAPPGRSPEPRRWALRASAWLVQSNQLNRYNPNPNPYPTLTCCRCSCLPLPFPFPLPLPPLAAAVAAARRCCCRRSPLLLSPLAAASSFLHQAQYTVYS
ncbi:hypothetical protein C4D60_Mb09t09320 [Musa balbisiana]|uniref:Uncharacterized protein n=1 Tax=Musa balbisiana TaxID=52838 RepID=A0A4S8IF65_MUSBA|nr:hypothetical protein C4D60_Mb09t09320 [Musa balbisiana]